MWIGTKPSVVHPTTGIGVEIGSGIGVTGTSVGAAVGADWRITI